MEVTTPAVGVPTSGGDGSATILLNDLAGLKSVSTTAAPTAPEMVCSSPSHLRRNLPTRGLQTAPMVDPEDRHGDGGACARGAFIGGEASGSHYTTKGTKKNQKKERSGKTTSRKSKKLSGPEDVPVPSIEVEGRGGDHESSRRRIKEKGRVSKPGAKKS